MKWVIEDLLAKVAEYDKELSKQLDSAIDDYVSDAEEQAYFDGQQSEA